MVIHRVILRFASKCSTLISSGSIGPKKKTPHLHLFLCFVGCRHVSKYNIWGLPKMRIPLNHQPSFMEPPYLHMCKYEIFVDANLIYVYMLHRIPSRGRMAFGAATSASNHAMMRPVSKALPPWVSGKDFFLGQQYMISQVTLRNWASNLVNYPL